MKRRQVSSERKTSYYVGMVLIVVGLLTFLSVFVTGIANFGNFENFDGQVQSAGFRALAGMGMMVIGGILMKIGSRGLAGSGVVLDPEQARRDVEPWSRMAGGMVRDALDEAEIDLGRRSEDADMPFDEKLRRLHKLYEDGLISAEEYEREKKEILDSN